MTTPETERRSMLPVFSLAAALFALAIGIAAFAVAVTSNGDDTTRLTMPAAMADRFGTMNGQMMGPGGMGMGAAVDPEAMRDRCVSTMGAMPGIEDPTAFCDSMVELMTAHMGTGTGMMMPMPMPTTVDR